MQKNWALQREQSSATILKMIQISQPLALGVFGAAIFVFCKFQITRTSQHFLLINECSCSEADLKALYIEKINTDDMRSHYSGLS